MSPSLPTADAWFLEAVEAMRRSLSDRGRLVEGTGVCDAGDAFIELYTDIGPVPDKTHVNQDFVAAWLPNDPGAGAGLDWAVAVSDGLTTSFWAERGAALAVFAALVALADGLDDPLALLKSAAKPIDAYAERLAVDPAESRPPSVPFPATWKYMLNKRGLLQTTLSVVWKRAEAVSVLVLGDAGALVRDEGGSRVLAECDLTTDTVAALSPGLPAAPTTFRRLVPRGAFEAAVFTDGVARGLGGDGSTLWSELDAVASSSNRGEAFLKVEANARPDDFADNLSLVLIRSRRGDRSHPLPKTSPP